MFRSVLCTLVLINTALADPYSKIDLQWKARALQAVERIQKLVKKNGDSKGKALSKREHCEWDLELLFYPFALPDLADVVRKPAGTDARSYFVLFSAKEDKKLAGQLGFVYDQKRQTPIAVKMPMFSLDEAEGFLIPGANAIYVNTAKCTFTIPIKDPLSATVEPR